MESTTYVGLDIAKDGLVATAVNFLGKRIDQSSLGSSDDELIAYLRRLPGTKRVALEACSMWEHYHDAAVAAGAEVVLSHPRKTRLIADASLKSDKVDSEALATLLRLDALPTAYVPDESTRDLRRLVRDRVFYRKQEKAVINHLYSILIAKGIAYEEGCLRRRWGQKWVRTLHRPEIDRGVDRLEDFERATKEIDGAIHRAYTESREAELLGSIPGIGELTAVILVAFLCPIGRFRSFDDLSSYCGLCPTTYQSASTLYHGGLKPDCNHILRWALIEASWGHRLRARGSYVSRVGRRNGKRKGAKRGAVDAAHALLRIVFAILKRGTPYSPHAPGRPSCKIETATSP